MFQGTDCHLWSSTINAIVASGRPEEDIYDSMAHDSFAMLLSGLEGENDTVRRSCLRNIDQLSKNPVFRLILVDRGLLNVLLDMLRRTPGFTSIALEAVEKLGGYDDF